MLVFGSVKRLNQNNVKHSVMIISRPINTYRVVVVNIVWGSS